MADETAVAVVEWISTERAGEILGGAGKPLSKRRVLEYAQAGALKSRRIMDQRTRQTVVEVHAGDVERLREERGKPRSHTPRALSVKIPVVQRQGGRYELAEVGGATVGEARELARQYIANNAGGGGRVTWEKALGARRDADRESPPAIADLALKLWLTEDEAVRYTGVGRGALRARVTPEAIGPRGALVYRRRDLEAL